MSSPPCSPGAMAALDTADGNINDGSILSEPELQSYTANPPQYAGNVTFRRQMVVTEMLSPNG